MGAGASTNEGLTSSLKPLVVPIADPVSTDPFSSSQEGSLIWMQDDANFVDIELDDDDCVRGDGTLILVAVAKLFNQAPGSARYLRLVAETTKLTTIPNVDTPLPIQLCSLNFSSSTSLQTLRFTTPNTTLKQLNLSCCTSLFSTPESSFSLVGLGGTLLHLDVSFVPLSKVSFAAALHPLTALLHLCLDGCELETLTVEQGQPPEGQAPPTTTTTTTSANFLLAPLKSTLVELHLADNGLESLASLGQISTLLNLSLLNLAENDVQNISFYKKTITELLPNLTKLDAYVTVGAEGGMTKLEDLRGLREAVEAGDSLHGSSAMEKEFDQAMQGKVDNSVVG